MRINKAITLLIAVQLLLPAASISQTSGGTGGASAGSGGTSTTGGISGGGTTGTAVIPAGSPQTTTNTAPPSANSGQVMVVPGNNNTWTGPGAQGFNSSSTPPGSSPTPGGTSPLDLSRPMAPASFNGQQGFIDQQGNFFPTPLNQGGFINTGAIGGFGVGGGTVGSTSGGGIDHTMLTPRAATGRSDDGGRVAGGSGSNIKEYGSSATVAAADARLDVKAELSLARKATPRRMNAVIGFRRPVGGTQAATRILEPTRIIIQEEAGPVRFIQEPVFIQTLP